MHLVSDIKLMRADTFFFSFLFYRYYTMILAKKAEKRCLTGRHPATPIPAPTRRRRWPRSASVTFHVLLTGHFRRWPVSPA